MILCFNPLIQVNDFYGWYSLVENKGRAFDGFNPLIQVNDFYKTIEKNFGGIENMVLIP